MGEVEKVAITLTEAAADRVSRFLANRGKGIGIRLAVRTSGCSGMAYVLEFADEAESEDVVFEDRGVKVLQAGDRGFGNVSAAPSVPSVLVEPFFGSNQQECILAQERLGAYAESLIVAFEAFAAGL